MEAPLQRPGWLNSDLMQLNSVFWLSLLSGCQWSGAKNSNSLFTWLDCKEIKLIYPKGNQSWIFMERTDSEAEVPILWPPDGNNWLTGKDPDACKDWRQEEKGTRRMASLTQWVWVWASSWGRWRTAKPGMLQSTWSQKVRYDWANKQQITWFFLLAISPYP